MTTELEIDVEEFKKDYLLGMLVTDLQIKYNCGKKLVTNIKKRHCLKRPPITHNKRIDIPYDKVVQLYNKRLSTKKIGQKYKCTDATIRNILNRVGVKIRCGHAAHIDINIRKKIDKFIELYEKGKSAYFIAKRFKTNEGTVRKILRENNIKIRTSQESCLINDYKQSKEQRKQSSERMKNGGAIKAMKGNKKTNTKPMKIFEQMLINAGISYEKEKVIENKAFDFFIKDNILVEIDGDYWHSNPKIYGIGKNNSRFCQPVYIW